MKGRILYYILLNIYMMVLFFSCSDDPIDINGADIAATSGVFIINEGNFNHDNATLSYYDYSTGQIFNQMFFAANEIPLGDVAQSMTIHNQKAYLVINNSGKIYIIDPSDMTFIDKIAGLTSPRNITFINDSKAYITDLYSKSIFIYDDNNHLIASEIDVNNNQPYNQHSTEQMILYGKFAFITCWSYDNKVLVIDTETDRLADSIEVGKQPNSIVLDHNNKIWVLSDGGFTGSAFGQELASLSRIDPETREVELKMHFTEMSSSPTDLCLNGNLDTLYYIDGDVYRMAIHEGSLPAESLIEAGDHTFYSMDIDPSRNIVYLGDAVDYQQNGWVYRYTPSGAAIDSFQVGVMPGDFCFWHKESR